MTAPRRFALQAWLAAKQATGAVVAVPRSIKAAVVEAVRPRPAADPWYADDARKRAVNEAARAARADRGSWLGGRQRGWLRSREPRAWW